MITFFKLYFMKKIPVLILLFILKISMVFSQNDTLLTSTIECAEGEWELVFNDEFDDGTLDAEKWITWYPNTDNGSDQCAFCRTHGNEGQIYKDENVVVTDGRLKLISRRESLTWFNQQRDFTSGMIHSRQIFGLGRYEIRAKLPKGMGFWPAIWTYGNTTSELDILEAGMQHPRRYHMSIHNRNIRKMLHKRRWVLKDLSAGFHTYSMQWDSSRIEFGIDNNVLFRISPYRSKWGCIIKRCPVKPGKYRKEPIFPPASETLHLIINLAIGNESTPFTSSPDEKTVFPNQMEVDWIRYYQRK